MKIYIAAISLLFAISSEAQRFSDTVLTVLKSENLISHVIHHPKFIEHNFLSADSTDFEVMAYSDMVYHTYKSINGVEANILFTYVYAKHDSIFLVKVTTSKVNYQTGKRWDSVIYYRIDTAMLSDYITQHNNMYYSAWTISDVVNRVGSFSCGQFCFFDGDVALSLSDNAKKLSKLVKDRSIDKLKDWASSFSKYERALGSAGLFFLILQGDRLNDELLDLVGTNQESKLILHTCNHTRDLQMREALNPLNLKEIYTYLKNSKLL